MDLEEKVEGFQETVPLMINVTAAALTPTPHPTLHLASGKEKHHKRPEKHPFGPEVPQLAPALITPGSSQGWQLPLIHEHSWIPTVLPGEKHLLGLAPPQSPGLHLPTWAHPLSKPTIQALRLKEISTCPQEQDNQGRT
jgi:hypothetical protein